MKNLIFALLALFLCTVYCPAEMLDSVTFNPARLGQYERLKVSDDLTSPGGVEARSLSVRSNGAVSVNNAGNYKIPQAEVKGSLDMTSTEFKTPIVDSRGGKASFERTNPNISSHIEQLTGNVLKAKANVLRAQEISVLGSRSTDYEDNQIQGLKLGGNDIPNREGCSGLNWYARTAQDGNTYKVLGMGSCTDETCTGSPAYGRDDYTYDDNLNDTCDGNNTARFQCPSGGGKKDCIDVFKVSYVWDYSAQGNAGLYDQDTCPGNDGVNQFTGSPAYALPGFTCKDIFYGGNQTAENVVAGNWYCTLPLGNYSTMMFDGFSGIYGGYMLGNGVPQTMYVTDSGYYSSSLFNTTQMSGAEFAKLVCPLCTGKCEDVMVHTQIGECKLYGVGPTGIHPPVRYRIAHCRRRQMHTVTYKREVWGRRVSCCGGEVSGSLN